MRLGKGTLPGANKNENFREIKYVITNPKRSIKLRADDLVFVLSQTDPSDAKTWDDDNLDSENFDTEIDIDFDGDRNLGQTNAQKIETRGTENQNDRNGAEDHEIEEEKHFDPFMEQRLQQNQFQLEAKKLEQRILEAKKGVIEIHKKMNKRDSNVVQDISELIENIVHGV